MALLTNEESNKSMRKKSDTSPENDSTNRDIVDRDTTTQFAGLRQRSSLMEKTSDILQHYEQLEIADGTEEEAEENEEEYNIFTDENSSGDSTQKKIIISSLFSITLIVTILLFVMLTNCACCGRKNSSVSEKLSEAEGRVVGTSGKSKGRALSGEYFV